MTITGRSVVVGLALCALGACGTGPIDAVELDLVAHWTFDEGVADKVRDRSPNQLDGSIHGSTWSWISEGRFDKALHLEQGDYVTVDDFPNATSSWTVSVWVQVASRDIGKGEMTVISTEDVFKGGWEMNLTTSSDTVPATEQYHFGFYPGSGSTYDHTECADCLKPDEWQHVTAVVDGSARKLTIYLGDEPQTPVSIREVILPGVPTLYMGCWSTKDPARLLVASLDDISLWSRALRPEEIATLTRAPAP
jgi:hypothetical protein